MKIILQSLAPSLRLRQMTTDLASFGRCARMIPVEVDSAMTCKS